MSFKVVIPSAKAENLVACVRAVLSRDPHISPERIIVVDDGARAEAEPELPPGICWLQGIRPFIYARNVNLALAVAESDVVLLNDDALLTTPYGFTYLGGQVQSRPSLGLCSAGIKGAIGNPNQLDTGREEFRAEKRTLAFVCVYVPLSTYESLGPLDERFVAYGYEDNDYCARALQTQLELGIWDGCVVDHGKELVSTFRSRPDISQLLQHNARLFREKWGRDA